jgi:hypothetical protein
MKLFELVGRAIKGRETVFLTWFKKKKSISPKIRWEIIFFPLISKMNPFSLFFFEFVSLNHLGSSSCWISH